MPPYLRHSASWEAIWPIPALGLVVALLLYPVIRRSKFTEASFIAIFAMGLLGAVTGMLTGLSRESAVGAVLPSILSLLGGLVLYALGLQKGDARLISGCLIALTLNLLIGAFWGSHLREVGVQETLSRLEERTQGATARIDRADAEALVRAYRRSLELPEEEPEYKSLSLADGKERGK